MSLGNRINYYRQQSGLTQEQLAERMNVTRQTVSSWETGRTEPDIDTLHRISVYLDVTVEELIYSRRLFQSKEDVIVKSGGTVKTGIGFGSALAMVVSYAAWESIGWAILHGIFGWGYIIYYAVKYL